MPELPEVETTVRYLRRKVLNRTFLDAWTDSAKIIKKPDSFNSFKESIKGKQIKEIWRRAKNIIFELSGGFSLLIHLKMTGHLLVGNWELKSGVWKSAKKGPLEEPVNKYIHLMFWLDSGLMLTLSDLRKFAKVELWETKKLIASPGIKKLGPEPLDPSFNFQKLRKALRKRGRIKQVLMDQNVIAGIGNIYADEILWEARIHPLRSAVDLKEKELKSIYQAIKKILKKAVELGGTSVSDFRNPEGRPGLYGKVLKVYQQEGKKCPRCKGVIKRIKIGGRSAHFCPVCQKP